MMYSQGDLRHSLLQRAQDLFALCDRQGKGYAFKDELGALGEELPLSPEQLETVFDALDVDGDGRLTLQEFSEGFGMFLGIDNQPRNPLNCNGQLEEEEEDEDEELEELMDHLGARNLFTDEDYVREMWRRVRKDDPVMRSNFENFISKMAADLRESVEDRENLQYTMKSRDQENESRVQSLYAEMEEQLRMEKEDALAREHRKEQQVRDELETELQLKDQQLQELLEKHAQMEKQLEELNSGEVETKYENKMLEKDRDKLESKLSDSEKTLHDMKSHLTLLRKKSLDEKRKRAQSALKVSEGIALERENLVLELQTLKEKNKQLLDEKDELAHTVVHRLPPQKSPRKVDRSKDIQHSNVPTNRNKESGMVIPEKRNNAVSLDRMLADAHPLGVENTDQDSFDCLKTESKLALIREEEEEDNFRNNLNFPTVKGTNSPKHKVGSEVDKITASLEETCPKFDKFQKIKTLNEETAPTRVFKVVFVGDSGVGKTSILQRFCTESFKSMYSATVGLDFQVKTINVEGEKIALQLWDTAGQERFRSMTQQYFRKADGLIVVYDVTSETTYKNVRNWMHSIQEGVQDNAVVLLLGNKVDVCESEDDRVVRTKDGERMADEFGTLFYETSAKTGTSVRESIEGLACVLKSKEDEAMEQVLKLQAEILERKKKRCC